MARKYYVVWQGHKTGVFETWGECQQHIKNYPGAKYKSFTNLQAAESAYYDGFNLHLNKAKKSPTKKVNIKQIPAVFPSISVDAACSGNPGKMEYQGVDTATAKRIFHLGPIEEGTNNIGEFLALVHGLALLKKKGSKQPIYTDSKTAMAWIRKKKANTKLKQTARNTQLFELIKRAEKWLHNNTFETTILKWDTKNWGEIPADFGRK